MKSHVTCEECGSILEENGIYDLAKSIIYHIDSGDCETYQIRSVGLGYYKK